MLNETKHVETDKKKLTDLAKNATQISREGYDSLLGRMYFIGNDDYENFLVFAPMLSSLILGSNRNVTNWISTIISSEKIKPFNNGLEPTISNLANGRVYLKLTNSILLQKSFSWLYGNFTLILYIVCELNSWPRNPANKFTLKNCLFGTVEKLNSLIMIEK